MAKLVSKPLFSQARDVLASRILAGEWKPGEFLSNEVDLARDLGVSLGTCRKALDLLESERLITRQQGRGSFVNDPTSQELSLYFSKIYTSSGQHIGGSIKLDRMALENARPQDAHRLQVREGDPIYKIERSRTHHGKPFMREDVLMPAALFPGLDQRELSSCCAIVIAAIYGVLLGKALERVSVGKATSASAKTFKLAMQTDVLLLERTIMTREGVPAEWRKAECMMGDLYYETNIA